MDTMSLCEHEAMSTEGAGLQRLENLATIASKKNVKVLQPESKLLDS